MEAYFRWRLLSDFAPYLSKRFVDEHFAFYGTALRGISQNGRVGSAASGSWMAQSARAWASSTSRHTSRPNPRRAWTSW